jgi:hypothetical protein
MLAPIAGLGALTVAIGLLAQPLVTYSQQAAAELTDRERYVRLVLGPAAAGPTQLADETAASETAASETVASEAASAATEALPVETGAAAAAPRLEESR